jgi:hypothetical protein
MGGAAVLRVPDDAVDATLDNIRENDPYVRSGIAQWEMWPWTPVIGTEDLDRL